MCAVLHCTVLVIDEELIVTDLRDCSRSTAAIVQVLSSSHIFVLEKRYHIFIYFGFQAKESHPKIFAKDIGSFIVDTSNL